MSDAPLQLSFPLARTATLLTACALAAGASAWLAVPGQGLAIAATIGFVWLVSLMSLIFVASYAQRGARAIALAHFTATGGRVLLCLLAGAVGVVRLGLPAKPVLLSLAAIYFPLLMIESICVARHVRALYAPAKEALR